mmetsp:Transcript_15871/g.20986  ORF Transcript_15871/g.20986 Transcript_15871/m.20986 type:complete len:425 (+) Transcript_15871:154-1428(+)
MHFIRNHSYNKTILCLRGLNFKLIFPNSNQLRRTNHQYFYSSLANTTISNDALFDTLRETFRDFKDRRQQLMNELSNNHDLPPSRLTELSRELSEVSEAASTVDDLEAKESELADLVELIAGDDEELAEMARLEKDAVAEEVANLRKKMLAQVVPKDEDDQRGVILELRAGTGGDEAALFTNEMLEMYRKFSQANGWNVGVLQRSQTDLGGCKEATLNIQGVNVYQNLKYESGIHRVQRVPVNDVRVHTSAVSVVVLPEVEEMDVQINPSDLKIETFRASGAGGQHVNTTESAVRITHIPTGAVVAIQDERSQHQNKAKAMKLLSSRIYEHEKQKRDSQQNSERRGKMGSGDRSGRIRTYNFPQDRITEHRTGYTTHSLGKVLVGEGLEDIIQSLIEEETQAKLEVLLENRLASIQKKEDMKNV